MLTKQGSFILRTVIDNQNTIRIFTCLLYCAADEARFVIGRDIALIESDPSDWIGWVICLQGQI
jgi:hypothetical protein